jgi:osmotically inducible lipoprotein OsmB
MDTRILKSAAAAALALALGACAYMTNQERSTVAGAAIGGVAGNVVTGGSTAGTLGGAAVGGVVGHEVSKP